MKSFKNSEKKKLSNIMLSTALRQSRATKFVGCDNPHSQQSKKLNFIEPLMWLNKSELLSFSASSQPAYSKTVTKTPIFQTHLSWKFGYSRTVLIVKKNFLLTFQTIQKSENCLENPVKIKSKMSKIPGYFRVTILGRCNTFSNPTPTYFQTYAMHCKKFLCCAAELLLINACSL